MKKYFLPRICANTKGMPLDGMRPEADADSMKSPEEDASAAELVSRIRLVRRQRVLIDSDLAALYGVPTHRLNEAVKRNSARFPDDFAFRLGTEEAQGLISQIAISKPGRGGRRKPPLVFTEHGAIMAASILNSERAIQALTPLTAPGRPIGFTAEID